MSDASRQSLKISREGIVLIKSFEGFRPRAIPREEGGWVIGYGHTLSAREGASVSEADAELLLRYDLLPVEKALNDTVPSGLNQHQFDALVSFAFSVGLDAFLGSDVLQRLNAGQAEAAAEAMIGWPEPALPEAALRRRAAERALFSADPAGPVALAELLAAPLPPPAPASVEIEAETLSESPSVVAGSDPRSVALAALLGETPPSQESAAEPAPVTPVFAPVAAEPETAPDIQEPAVVTPITEPEPGPHPDSEPVPEVGSAESAASAEFALPEDPGFDPSILTVRRFSPYAAGIVGPLPYLLPTSPVAPQPAAETAEAPAVVATEAESPPAETVLTPPAPEPAPVHAAEGQLVLTSPEDAPEPAVVRPVWPSEQRVETESAEAGLFGEDLALTQGGGPVLRHEIEIDAPARFDWSETGAFIIMGAVGLTSFGAAMAAFRLASEQSGGGSETTVIAWVLAVIGGACVGVSSFNLYRRWGLPGGD